MEVQKSHNAVCAVALCPSPKNSSVSYHRFPKEKELRKKWIIACKRDDQFNPSTGNVCSEHFLPSDFQHDLRGELLGLPLKRRLNENAVPTLKISPSDLKDKKSESERSKRIEKREQRAMVETLLSPGPNDDSSTLPSAEMKDASTQKTFEGIHIGIQVNVPKGKLKFLLKTLAYSHINKLNNSGQCKAGSFYFKSFNWLY